MTVSDEELFKRYHSGDESGMTELIERYRAPLFTVILRMVGSRPDAQDIFQETFCRIIKARQRFDYEKKLSTWVYAIATNLCRDHLRRNRRSPFTSAQGAREPAGPHDPEADSRRRELRQAVDGALARLPAEQREVFLLREYGGMSFKEIAGLTRSNLNTVLGRMRLAVKKLRLDLDDFKEGL